MTWYRNRTSRTVDGIEVPGVTFPAFIHNFDYHLTNIVAYRDGMVECWGLVPFDEFVRKVAAGWVVTSVPEGAWVSIHDVARFRVSDVQVIGAEAELVKDVAGAIDELNGRGSPLWRVLKLIMAVRDSGDLAAHLYALRQAYADLPAYQRRYAFGSRGERYRYIRAALDGDGAAVPMVRRADG